MTSQVSKSRLWWERPLKAVKAAVPSRALAFIVVLMLLVLAAQAAQAQTLTVLHSFGGKGDGAFANSNLLLDAQGNLYGTLAAGGAHDSGAMFEWTANGTYKVLYSFTGKADGHQPDGPLVEDARGNLYGVTFDGVGNYGTVFKLAPNGKLSVLYSFSGGADGGIPEGGLARDAHGNLYGTTSQGGDFSNVYCSCCGCGTVFEVAANGTFKVLYAFQGPPGDGYSPGYGLVRDVHGNLYGISNGGTQNCGIVFEVTPTGSEKVLYDFGVDPEGGWGPGGDLIREQGNFYGTTGAGGTFNHGTVFELGASGTESVLYNFGAFKGDARPPNYGVVRDRQGNLYGTSYWGGAKDWGAVFEVAADGTEKVLYSFTGWRKDQQSHPVTGLTLDSQGNLYGTTTRGGAFHRGTLFKLTP